MRNIAIIGAGISGLSLAWFLKKRFGKSVNVALYEASDCAGGLMRTFHHKGFIFELGPHSLRARGAGLVTLNLIKELGLTSQLVGSASLDRYLKIKGKLQKLPSGIFSLLTSRIMRPHLLTFMREWSKKRGSFSDETVYEFATRRFSKEIAEQFFDPLIKGIFAGDIRKLSMSACLPELFEMERQYGSITCGMFFKKRQKALLATGSMPSLFSFKEGLGTLTTCLSGHLQENLYLKKQVTSLKFDRESAQILFTDGSSDVADCVYCTASLDLAKAFTTLPIPEIPFASIGCVHLGFEREIVQKRGFGYLIPASENCQILGVIWDSCVFPDQLRGKTRMTVMIDLDKVEDLRDEALIQIALDEVQLQPDVVICTRAKRAIPQYILGYRQKMLELEGLEPKLKFLGCSYTGISVNDCIQKASEIVDLMDGCS